MRMQRITSSDPPVANAQSEASKGLVGVHPYITTCASETNSSLGSQGLVTFSSDRKHARAGEIQGLMVRNALT